MRALLVLPFLAACTQSPTTISGPTSRFAVDGFRLPIHPGDAAALGSDLDGDGVIDNAFANAMAALVENGDATTDVADLIADGVVASSIELTFGDDHAIGIRFIGQSSDDPPLLVGTESNSMIATDGLQAEPVDVVLPVLVDADPTAIVFDHIAIQLVPDGAGFTVGVQGLVDSGEVARAASIGLVQMVYTNPRAHDLLSGQLDTNHDGVITVDETASSEPVRVLTAPDIGGTSMSFGFGLHVTPCDAGSCVAQHDVVDHCHDRVQDGDETGLDCGGGCVACAAGAACLVDADCDSGTCAAGACSAPTCSDGVLDQFETDVDCGSICQGCTSGQRCVVDADCASGHCTGSEVSAGTCE